MYFILFYKTCEDYVNKRAPFRSVHLSLAQSFKEKGLIIMAGVFLEPTDGAALIFKCDDKSIIEDFVKNDPYVQNGLITEWLIKKWNVVI